MKKRFLIFLSGSFVFFSFVAFSFVVHNDVFLGLDFDTTVRLQNHISRRFDSLFSFFSLSGSFEITIVILLVILAIRRKLMGFFILFIFGVMHVFEIYGKAFVEHLGPPFMFFRYNMNFFFPSSYVQPGYSYPSGHSARTLFISTLLAFFIARSKRISHTQKLIILGAIGLFDATMLISRVYLGEHWTSDVIGGGLLGASLALLSLVFF